MGDSGRLLTTTGIRQQTRTNGKSSGHWNSCECCPYGYHLDIGFVKYAEETVAAGQQPTVRPPREERRAKRRSRQFAEEKRSNGQSEANGYYGHSVQETAMPLMSPSLEGQSVFSDSLENIVSDFEETLTKHKRQIYTDPQPNAAVDYNNRRPQTAMADVITNAAGGGGRLTRYSSVGGVGGGRLEDYDGYTSDFSSGYAVPHVRRRPNGLSLGGEDQLQQDQQRPNYLRLANRPILGPAKPPSVTYDVPNGRSMVVTKMDLNGISPGVERNLAPVSPWASHYGPASELSTGGMSDSVSSLSSVSSFQQSPHQLQTNVGRMAESYEANTRRDAYESDSGLLAVPSRQYGGRLNGSYRSISGRVAANIDSLANRITPANTEPSAYEIRRQAIEHRSDDFTRAAQEVSSSNRNVLQTIRDQMADSLQEMKVLAGSGSTRNTMASPMKTPVMTPTKEILRSGRLSSTPSRSAMDELLNRSCESPAPPVPLRSHSVSRMSEVESPLTVSSPIGRIAPTTNLGRLALSSLSQSSSPAPHTSGTGVFQSLRRENSFSQQQSSGYSSNSGRDDTSYCSDSELALGDRSLERFASLRRSRRLLQSISNASVIPELASRSITTTTATVPVVRSLNQEFSTKSTLNGGTTIIKSPEIPPKPSRVTVVNDSITTPEGEKQILKLAEDVKSSGPPVISSDYRKQFSEWKKHLEDQQAKLTEPEQITRTTMVTSVSVKLQEVPETKPEKGKLTEPVKVEAPSVRSSVSSVVQASVTTETKGTTTLEIQPSECEKCADGAKIIRRSFGMNTNPVPQKVTNDNWTSPTQLLQRETSSNTELLPKVPTSTVGVATTKTETRDAVGGTCIQEKIFQGILRHQIVNTVHTNDGGACALCLKSQPELMHRSIMTDSVEQRLPVVPPKPAKMTTDVATDPHVFVVEQPVEVKMALVDQLTNTDDVSSSMSTGTNTDFVVISTSVEQKTVALNTEKVLSRTVFTATNKTESAHKQSGTDVRYRDAQVTAKWSGVQTSTNTVSMESSSTGSGEDSVEEVGCAKCVAAENAALMKKEIYRISVGVGHDLTAFEPCQECERLAKVIKNDVGTDYMAAGSKLDAYSNTETDEELVKATVAVGECDVKDVICNICCSAGGLERFAEEQTVDGKLRSRSFDTAELDSVHKAQPPLALVCPRCKCPVTREDMFASRESLSSLASSRAHSMEQIISPLEGSDYQPNAEMTSSCEGRLEKFDFAKPRGTRATALSQAAATKKLLTSDDSKKGVATADNSFKRGTFMSRSVRVDSKKGDSLAYITDKNAKESRTDVKTFAPVVTKQPDSGLKRKVEIKGRPQTNGSRIAIPPRIPPVPPRTSPTSVRRNIVRSVSATNGPIVTVADTSSKEEVAEALDSLAPLPSDLSRSWSATASLHSGASEPNGYVNPVSEQESIVTADHKLVGDVVENLPDLNRSDSSDSSGSCSCSESLSEEESPDEGSYDAHGNITPKCEVLPEKSNDFVMSDNLREACQILNSSLCQPGFNHEKKDWAVQFLQHAWLKNSARKAASPKDVEKFIDVLESFSRQLLHKVVNFCDENENTALHYAVSHGSFDIVSLLLDSKVCNINKPNKAGYTPVMLAALCPMVSETDKVVIQRLFQMGDVNIKASQHGQTALMLAVSHGRLETTRMLLDAGAGVNIQDEDGSTGLMCAAEHGHRDIVKLLLSNSEVDASLADFDGSTALSIAVENGHRDIGVLIYAHLNYARGSSPALSRRQISLGNSSAQST